jgi:acyl dehydratase
MQLSGWSREADFPAWNRYAAVNYEFIDIHMDDEAGRRAGFEAAIGMGNLTLAYLHNAIQRWFGDSSDLRSFRVRFIGPVVRGRTISVSGRVVGLDDQEHLGVDLELQAVDNLGNQVAEGGARVVLEPILLTSDGATSSTATTDMDEAKETA